VVDPVVVLIHIDSEPGDFHPAGIGKQGGGVADSGGFGIGVNAIGAEAVFYAIGGAIFIGIQLGIVDLDGEGLFYAFAL